MQRQLRLALGLLLTVSTAFDAIPVNGAAAKQKAARKTPAPATKKPSSSAPQKAAAKKAVPAQASASRKKSAPVKVRRSSQRARAVRRAGQAKPSKERYVEIQEALKNRGYLSGEPDGIWGQEEAEALKRFQQDQNLEASGKLTSLSLIALGLGPKRTQSAQTPLPKGEPK